MLGTGDFYQRKSREIRQGSMLEGFPDYVTYEPRWQKSSYSNNGGDCVEVAANLVAGRGVVPVRDSKDVYGPVLDFSAAASASFVAGLGAGESGTI